MDIEKRLLYPELIYRRWQGDAWVEAAVLKIPRRCYAPEEFAEVIRSHGFRIINRWGGYAGEAYGEADDEPGQRHVEVDVQRRRLRRVSTSEK